MANQQQLKSCEYCGGYGDEDEYKCDNCGRPLTKLDTDEEEGYVKPKNPLEAPFNKLFDENIKLKEQVRDLLEENEKLKEEEEEEHILTTMTRFHQQMKKVHQEEDYNNVFSNDAWTIQDYKDFFWCVDRGYLIQADFTTTFMINEEWEGEDIYLAEFGNFGEEFNGCCADCDDEEKKECRDCKIEAKKHCELCCGYECEVEEYCYKNSTIDTYQNDNCVCSVGGCIKPTEFDMVVLDCREEEEEVISEWHEAQGR
tara:strand:- start:60 stop:827 length:768 start_codon:yes stop_codon:yes gene_type:complete